MVRKALTYLVLALAVVAVVGSVAYVVFDSSRSHARVSGLERKTSRSLSALERAKAALREKIREEVRKEEAKAVKKGAKTIAARKEKSKKYLFELAKFYRAMTELGYLWENEAAFTLFFYEDYGKCRGVDLDSYRRTFNYATTKLTCLQYTNYKDEIRGIVLG